MIERKNGLAMLTSPLHYANNITAAAESLPIVLTSPLHYANTSCYSNINLMMH